MYKILGATGNLFLAEKARPVVEKVVKMNGETKRLIEVANGFEKNPTGLVIYGKQKNLGFGMSDSEDDIYIGNLTSTKIKSILQSLVKYGYYDFTSMRYQSAKRLSKVVFDDENHLPYTSEITIDAFPSQLISINCASNKLPHIPNTVVDNEMLFGNIEDDTDEEEDEDMD